MNEKRREAIKLADFDSNSDRWRKNASSVTHEVRKSNVNRIFERPNQGCPEVGFFWILENKQNDFQHFEKPKTIEMIKNQRKQSFLDGLGSDETINFWVS